MNDVANIGVWCNGNTQDFDSCSTGSSPVTPANKIYAGLAQQGEHMPYKHRVGGSSPSLRTRWFSSAGRAFALQARGRRFEPVNHHQWQVGTLHCASLPVFEEEIPRGKRNPSNESAQVVFVVKRRTSSQQEVLKSAGYITYVM